VRPVSPRSLAGLGSLLLVLAAAAAAGGGPTSPHVLAPVPDLSVEAGSFDERALDLSDHFAFDAGSGADYWTVRVLRPPTTNRTDPALFVNGTWLGVAATDPEWTGAVAFRLEACSVQSNQRACVASNDFRVVVTASAGPVPSTGQPSVRESTADSATTFSLGYPPGAAAQQPPLWLVDGEPAGYGEMLRLTDLAPGEHRIVVLYETEDGQGIVFRDFWVVAPPPATPLGPLLALSAGLLILLGAAASARSRSFLLTAIVGHVYPRVRKDSLLDHFNRGALHQVIKENPGIHFSELRRRVGISHGTAIWHLRALEQAGIVRAMRVGAYTTYHVGDAPLELETYGLTPGDRQVLSLVREQPGIALSDLARRGDRSLGATSRTVTRLVALGQVTTELSRRRRHVFPRDEATARPEGAGRR